jgi:alpha-ketoglutarate-dependent taurine dioxygenase
MTEILRTPITDRSAWTAEDMQRDTSWLYTIPAAGLAEIDAALVAAKAAGRPYQELTRNEFALPSIAQELRGMVEEVENGRGFVVLRGIPAERYSPDDARIVMWGLGTHWGTAISQNSRGERLCAVTDEGGDYNKHGVRGYQTNAHLPFHCDNADAVALFFLRQAPVGGTSLLSSATSIYNAILEQHPEYLETLARGFYHDQRKEQRPGLPEHSGHRIPVYSWYEGKLSCRYERPNIRIGAQLAGEPLSELDQAAVDFIDDTARSDKYCLRTDFQPGDIQLINNHTTLHSRTQYQDHDDPAKKRFLLRLWLNLEEGRPLTYEFSNRYGPDSGRMGVPAWR